MIDGYGDQN